MSFYNGLHYCMGGAYTSVDPWILLRRTAQHRRQRANKTPPRIPRMAMKTLLLSHSGTVLISGAAVGSEVFIFCPSFNPTSRRTVIKYDKTFHFSSYTFH